MTAGRVGPVDRAGMRVVEGGKDGAAFLIGLAADEGWDPGVNDVTVLREVDASAVLIAEVDGEPVGGISVVGWDDAFCFVGYYLVAAPWRGRGIGRSVWVEAVRLIGPRAAGLDAVPAVEGFYAREGFVTAGETYRYEGVIAGVGPEPSTRTRRAVTGDLPQLVELDARHGTCPRSRYLRVWLEQDGVHAVVSLAEDGHRVTGFGAVRESLAGWRLGPVLVEEPAMAPAVVRAVMDEIPAPDRVARPHLSVHVPGVNRAAVRLFSSFGFTEEGRTIRMYRGTVQDRTDETVFGIACPEIG